LRDVLVYAHQVTCTSNLRHIGLATKYYLDEHDGDFFPLVEDQGDSKLWYFGFEANASQAMAVGEGNRILDRTRGRLYRYLGTSETVETCPAVPFGSPYKPKFKGKPWTYGINYYLSYHPKPASPKGYGNIGMIRPSDVSRTAVFADSAQVNDFLAPASQDNPMIEDWYYLQPDRRYVQFRHGGRANVLFADWHVEAVGPAEGSLDTRLPDAMIGMFDEDVVLLKPCHWQLR